MEVYQPLNCTFNVSKEWSKAVGPVVIEELLNKALNGQRGAVTINGITALVVDDGFGLVYIRMQELKREKSWSDVYLPVKASIVKFAPNTPSSTDKVSLYDLPVKLSRDHPFPNWFESKSNCFRVVTAAPVLEQIFESRGIKGEEVYNYAIETIYKTHKGLIPRNTFQPALKDDSIALVKKISDDQWEIKCYNRLVPPQSWRHITLTYPWIACGFRMSKNPPYQITQNY